MNSPLDIHLANYRALVARVDELAGRIAAEFRDHIACRKGCSACCRHLSLFPVEAAALAAALKRLPAPAAEHIRARAAQATPAGPCPLLEEGACLLYADRPIICRTHGLPLLATGEEGRRIDFCPDNFRGLDTLPAAAVVDLDRLNTLLAAVNALFVSAAPGSDAAAPERLSIAEALLGGGDKRFISLQKDKDVL
jgi:Fe-S-cluster containining protein